MRTRISPDLVNLFSVAVLILGVVVIGVVLILLVRLERGLLGLVAAGAVVALLLYWLREFRRMVKRELGVKNLIKKRWNYDLRVTSEDITFISEVPGHPERVDALVVERILRINGGENFDKEITLPAEAEVTEKAYGNGVLRVKLRKIFGR